MTEDVMAGKLTGVWRCDRGARVAALLPGTLWRATEDDAIPQLNLCASRRILLLRFDEERVLEIKRISLTLAYRWRRVAMAHVGWWCFRQNAALRQGRWRRREPGRPGKKKLVGAQRWPA
jgi:hypothetical protein